MCRLGFVSSDKSMDITDIVKSATMYYGVQNNDGVGIASVNGGLHVAKSHKSALSFWGARPHFKFENTKSVVFHVRFKTSGKLNFESTHPFVGENGKSALVHNGCLFGYDETRKCLKESGHKFASEVDSEVLLHAYEQFGENFVQELKKRKVSGSATIVIAKSNGNIIAYTNNHSLVLFRKKGCGRMSHGDITIGMSDDSLRDYMKAQGFQQKEAKKGFIYEICDGKILSMKKVGDLYEAPATVSYTVKKDIGTFNEPVDKQGNDVNAFPMVAPNICEWEEPSQFGSEERGFENGW